MAIVMTIIGTATTFANNNINKFNHKPAAMVVVHNNNHHCKECHKHHAMDHRHMTKPVHNCLCNHCKKMRHAIEMEMRRREAEIRRMEAMRHSHPEVNARIGHVAYNGR